MNTLFENTTEYTAQVYLKYVESHFKKYGYKYIIVTVIMAILIIYCAVLNAMHKNWGVFILLFISFFIYILYRYFSQIIMVKKEVNERKKSRKNSFMFCFYDNCFVVKNGEDINKLKYYQIRRINNARKYIYLYINKNHAFILAKEGFTKGTYKDFKKFIENKYKNRYKNILKRNK